MTAVNAELLAFTIELKKRLTGFVGACAEMTDCGEDVEAIKRAEAAICKARTALETGAVGTSAASEQNPITARDGGEAVVILSRLFDEKRPGYHDCIDAGEMQCAWCDAEEFLAALAAGGEK